MLARSLSNLQLLELLSLVDSENLTVKELLVWCSRHGIDVSKAIDQLGIYIACEYSKKRFTYERSDALICEVWSLVFTVDFLDVEKSLQNFMMSMWPSMLVVTRLPIGLVLTLLNRATQCR